MSSQFLFYFFDLSDFFFAQLIFRIELMCKSTSIKDKLTNLFLIW